MMKEIKGSIRCVNGKINIPKEYQINDEKKRVHVKMPWTTFVEMKGKFNNTVQQWFRREGKDKPYLPEGFVEFDGDRYEVEVIEDGKTKKD